MKTNLQLYFEKEYWSESSLRKMTGKDIVEIKNDTWSKKFRKDLKKYLLEENILPSDTDLKKFHEYASDYWLEFDTIGNQNNSRPRIADKIFSFAEVMLVNNIKTKKRG